MITGGRRRPRVAVVIPRYAPVFGGAENQCRLLIQELLGRGHADVPFVLTRRLRIDLEPREDIDGVPVVRLGGPGLSPVREYLFYAAAAAYLVRARGRYDVIHGHTTSIFGFFVTAAARVARRPVVLKLSSNGELLTGLGAHSASPGLARRAVERLRRRLARATTAHAHTVALNDEGLEELHRAGARRTHVIPNGVAAATSLAPEPEIRARHRRDLGVAPDAVAFVFTGRFVRPKGIDLLLPAFRSLADEYSTGVRLVLVGSGELQFDSIAELSTPRAPAADGIIVASPADDVRPYLWAADVFVFPSRHEGMPNSVLEAIAAGLPCVLSDIRPHRDIAERCAPHPIYFFRSGDADDLSRALRAAARDVVAARAAGTAAARGLADEFRIERVAEQYAALYDRMLG